MLKVINIGEFILGCSRNASVNESKAICPIKSGI